MRRIDTEPSFFTVLWTKKLLIGLIIVSGAGLGLLVSMVQPVVYTANASLQLIDPNTVRELADQMSLSRGARYIANQAELLESEAVAEEASKILDGDPSPDTIRTSVVATPLSDRDIIEIAASASEATDAITIANSMVEAYAALALARANTAEQELMTSFDNQQAPLDAEIAQREPDLAADPNAATLRIEQSTAINELRVIDRNRAKIANQAEVFGDGVLAFQSPDMPTLPDQPRPVFNVILGAALGFMIALGVAWVRGTRALK